MFEIQEKQYGYDIVWANGDHYTTFYHDIVGIERIKLNNILMHRFRGKLGMPGNPNSLFNKIYFVEIKHAERAVEWLESMSVLNQLNQEK